MTSERQLQLKHHIEQQKLVNLKYEEKKKPGNANDAEILFKPENETKEEEKNENDYNKDEENALNKTNNDDTLDGKRIYLSQLK